MFLLGARGSSLDGFFDGRCRLDGREGTVEEEDGVPAVEEEQLSTGAAVEEQQLSGRAAVEGTKSVVGGELDTGAVEES